MEQNNSDRFIGILVGIVVTFAVVVITYSGEKSTVSVSPISTVPPDSSVSPVVTTSPTETPTAPNTSSRVTQTPPVDVPKQTSSVYKDGTYTATGSYMSPGGNDQITVTLTLVKDVITDVSVTPAAGDRTSQRYQARFISGYKSYVVGKNIAGLNLGTISGSSLTPIGFNDALTQIRSQARA